MSFKSKRVKVNCPTCGKKVSVTLDKIARQGNVTCLCGQTISIKDKNGSTKKAIRALDNLKKAFKK